MDIIIAQSSTVYDQMLKQIEEQTAELRKLNKEFDRINTVNLKVSLLYEGCKKENRELKAENFKLTNIIGVMAENALIYLDMFESIFNTDEDSFKYEDLQNYLMVAEYMERRFQRTCNVNTIRRVKERMDKLPWE
jgi:hypothetical protein